MTNTLPSPITTLSTAQQASVVNLIRRAAATEIMPRFQNLSAFEIATKSRPDDLVTEADLASEHMITRGLTRLFPHALIIGEEAIAANPDLRGQMAEHEFTFVIDPIDGTWNYAKGIPLFGVILSVLRFGQPIFGLLYDPVMDDFIIADQAQNETAYVKANGQKRVLKSAETTDTTPLSGYMHYGLMPPEVQTALAPAFPQFQRATSLRCSCHEYRILAQGHVDFCLSSMLNPWDHAAGVLACQMAGGVSQFLDGAPYNAAQTQGYLLSATTPNAWERAAAILRPILDPSRE